MNNRRGSLLLAAAAASLLLAACGEEQQAATICTAQSCSGHGTCSEENGAPVCACNTGWAGAACDSCAAGYHLDTGAGTCVADAAGCQVNSCSGHGFCDDSSGAPVCTCDAGWTGAACDACAAGFHLDSGACVANEACQTGSCSGHGTCDDSTGTPVCTCEEGWAGAACDACAAGYHLDAGACVADATCQANSCNGHGTCSDASGAPVCTCAEGWAGAHCDTCAAGYHLDAGACVADAAGCQANSCSGHGTCDDSSGSPVCSCNTGYQGAACDACAQGYQDHAVAGTCVPGCALTSIDCGAHGDCDDANGTPHCACDTGYQGTSCGSCAAGFQDTDANGTCLADCATAALSCGSHGSCSVDGGSAHCACQTGYAGATCSDCAAGYTSDGAGGCVLDAGGDGATCDSAIALPLVTGTVTGDTTGSGDDYTPSCQSNDSEDLVYTFTATGSVEVAFQTSGYDTVLYLRSDCAGADLGCNDDVSYPTDPGSRLAGTLTAGTYYLIVDGYSGAVGAFTLDVTVSTSCPAGQISDGAGGCVDDPCDPDPCSGHGTCSVSGSAATCACSTGYAGTDCSSCAAGYTLATDGTCAPSGTGATCASAIPLPFATGSVTGTTAASGDDYTPGCVTTANDSEEVVYQLDVTGTAHVVLEATGYDTVLYLRSDCAGADVACNDDYTGLSRGSHVEADLTAGTYFVFVDGYKTTGTYTLSLQVVSSCQAGEVSDGAGGCVDDPCIPDPCSAANSHCVLALPTYACECDAGYVADSSGACVVDTNPQGESCADAIPLSGEGSVTGTTVGATDDGVGTCGSSSAGRPDRVYSFTVQARTRYEFLMTGYDTVLHLRSTCSDASTQIACNDDTQGTAAGLSGFVDPGTYYLFADSYAADGGAYTLDYKLRTDPCATDVCPGVPECVADADWGGHQCVCPAGTVAYNSSCVDDPCEPNPCTTVANQGRCTAQLPGNYTCSCNPGYIDDGAGGCMTDPNANQWTVMVFLNGDNNLDSYGDTDLQEMAAAGSNDYVNIIVLHDSSGNGDSRIVRVTTSGYEVIEERGEVDMGDWQTLRDFGVWTVQNYPARHYALVMWDHGDGWKAPPKALQHLKGFSNDDNGNGDGISISNGNYASALSAISTAAGGKLDVVGFDACLMGMYEVAKATAPYANYFVGSEETEPGNGWAYDGFLPGLVNNYSMSGLELGRSIVEAYYAASTDDATLAVVDLNTIPALDSALSSFADALRASPSLYSSLNSVRNSTQAFYVSDHRDLFHFARGVAAMSGASAAMVSTANALQTQLRTTVAHYRSQSDYPNAYGMAIYLPSTSGTFDTDYRGAGATWSTATTWDEFVADFAQ